MMKNLNKNISEQIKNNVDLYAKKILDLNYKVRPELITKYNRIQKEKILDDIKSTLNFLAASISVDSKELYFNYIKWLSRIMQKINIPLDEMLINFKCMKEILNKEILIDTNLMINKYIDESIKYFIYVYDDGNKKNQNNIMDLKIKEFLKFLLNFEKEKAIKFILDKIENQISIDKIYIEYIQGALYDIGELWMRGKISVAKEHYCTAVIQHIISLMYPYLFRNRIRKNQTMFAVSAGNELHEIGIRMVTDFFELDGWDTYYLGANIPVNSIIQELKSREVNLIAISITMGSNIQFAVDLINKIRADISLDRVKIIVGGIAFNEANDLWKKIEADGYGRNAVESVEVGNKLMMDQNGSRVKEK